METPPDQAADLPARVAQWIAGGETYEGEFKGEQREQLNDRDLVEAVVCLANGTGGVLLVGVEDDGTISGARPRHEAGRTDPLPSACGSSRPVRPGRVLRSDLPRNRVGALPTTSRSHRPARSPSRDNGPEGWPR
jgi:hypothetical protein